MKTIIKNIGKAYKKIGEADTALNVLRDSILPYFDFEHPCNFYAELQPSDGIVIGYDFANVYSITSILEHIESKGNIKSYEELAKLRI